MNRSGIALSLGVGMAMLAAALAGTASAQARPSTPFVIHEVTVDGAEQVARERRPLLIQPVTSVRSARLDAEAPAEAAGWFKDKSFPAGTRMFGAYTADHWSYCAVAESRSWLTEDQFICYLDRDDDGRFDAAMDSGIPFNGVPLLVFSTGEIHPLATPVPYSRIPFAEGPGVEYVITYEIVRPSGRAMRNGRNVPRTATHIIPSLGFRLPTGSIVPLTGAGIGRRIALAGGARATLRIKGAVIEILDVEDDDSVRYRVVQAIPMHVDQIMLQIITSTYWVAY